MVHLANSKKTAAFYTQWFLRLVLAGVFGYSGLVKLIDPGQFLIAVRNYELLGDPWATVVALVLPWVEVLCAAALLSGMLYRGALVLVMASLALFIGGIASAWVRGLDINCGCFAPSAEKSNYALVIARNVVLIGVAGALLWWRGQNSESGDRSGKIGRTLESAG